LYNIEKSISWPNTIFSSHFFEFFVISFVFHPEFFYNLGHPLVELGRNFESGKLVHIEPTLCLSEIHFIVKLTNHDFVVLILLEPLDALAFLPETCFKWLAWH